MYIKLMTKQRQIQIIVKNRKQTCLPRSKRTQQFTNQRYYVNYLVVWLDFVNNHDLYCNIICKILFKILYLS